LIELVGKMTASLMNTDEGPFIQSNSMYEKAKLLNGLDVVIDNVQKDVRYYIIIYRLKKKGNSI
jgi:hypothetical protein